MVRPAAVDEVAGVLEDQDLGEEDQHPGDHRGGASGAGSHEVIMKPPTILLPWSCRRPETRTHPGLTGHVTLGCCEGRWLLIGPNRLSSTMKHLSGRRVAGSF